MTEVKIERNDKTDTSIISFESKFTFEFLYDTLLSYFKEGPTTNIIYDFTHAGVGDLTAHHIDQLLNKAIRRRSHR